mmetsp:Transcript_33781/g.132772  ORF Transcript_33781/g.132772 Transcript_33781/m.132772 type:complete len:457 (-) Transcript_33781:1293-2663(-)
MGKAIGISGAGFVSAGGLFSFRRRSLSTRSVVKMSQEGKPYDLLVYGATGATGKRTAQYLLKNAPPELKWGIAGRSLEKLEQVREELRGSVEGGETRDIGIVVGSGDTSDEVAKAARVVATTVGPYTEFGEPLVKACCEHKADYLDLTGEPNFMRRMIDTYGKQAEENNVTVLHGCGFDSIPSDLGVLFLVEEAKKEFQCGLSSVTTVIEEARGGIGSGTIASIVRAGGDPDSQDPYGLQKDYPDPEKVTEAFPDLFGVQHVPEIDMYGIPFFLSFVNTRVVRRSASIFASERPTQSIKINGSDAYCSSKFLYKEFLGLKSKTSAYVGSAVVGGLFVGIGLALKSSTLRNMLYKGIINNSWKPKEEMVEEGRSKFVLVGKTDEVQPRTLVAEINMLDPGYGETSRLLAEASMMVALEKKDLPAHALGGGFYTPATAIGTRLLERLNEKADWIKRVK